MISDRTGGRHPLVLFGWLRRRGGPGGRLQSPYPAVPLLPGDGPGLPLGPPESRQADPRLLRQLLDFLLGPRPVLEPAGEEPDRRVVLGLAAARRLHQAVRVDPGGLL